MTLRRLPKQPSGCLLPATATPGRLGVTQRPGRAGRYPQEAADLPVLASLDEAIDWANELVAALDGWSEAAAVHSHANIVGQTNLATFEFIA